MALFVFGQALCKDHIEFRPENKAYPLMRYGFGKVLIQGKVIGVQRGPDQFKAQSGIPARMIYP